MAIFDLFSKRQRLARESPPDVFKYDEIPQPLRVQIIHILDDVLGTQIYRGSRLEQAYQFVRDTLCREYGRFELNKARNGVLTEVQDFILEERNVERVLDAVELCFRLIDRVIRKDNDGYGSMSPDDAIEELNARFAEQAVGYAYEQGVIVRVDSRLLHAEAIKPALHFLSEPHLAGANEEFLKSHEHYRAGRNKECVADCLKAFESTMKAICTKRGWTYGANDTAKPLIDVLFKHKLVPDYIQSEFAALRTVLESGVPTLRNRTSAHGQGAVPIELPAYLASYVLHLTASTILFLCEADKNLK